MVGLALISCLMVSAESAVANPDGVAGTMTAVDRGFFLICALLVLLMHGGLCLFAVGMARARFWSRSVNSADGAAWGSRECVWAPGM